MSKEKQCPINSHPQSDGMCEGDKCAWWDNEDEWCVIQSISNYIGHNLVYGNTTHRRLK